MSVEIEDEDVALNVLSKLRQYKTGSVVATRNVAVTDFGRLLLLSGGLTKLTLTTLTRSGFLKVSMATAANFNSVKIDTAANPVVDLNTGAAFDGAIEDLFFGSVHGGSGIGNYALINLFYSHEADIWYVLGTTTEADGFDPSLDLSSTVVKRTSNGWVIAENTFKGNVGNESYLLSVDSSTLYIQHTDIDGLVSQTITLSNYGSGNTWGLSIDDEVLTLASNSLIVSCKDTAYANDAGAAGGGVAVGQIYRNSTTDKFHTRMA